MFDEYDIVLGTFPLPRICHFETGNIVNKLILTIVLVLVSSPALAEKWTNVGTFTTVEFDRKLTIDVYGDSDSALRSGDFATLMVKGFGSDSTKADKVTFECVKKEIIWPGQKVVITQDHKDGSAILPASVMIKLHGMACKKWFEVWK